jgi:hypothetical protein
MQLRRDSVSQNGWQPSTMAMVLLLVLGLLLVTLQFVDTLQQWLRTSKATVRSSPM